MSRKEELVIIISKIKEKIYDKYNYLKHDGVSEFLKKYSEIKNLQNELDSYITEYNSLK